MKKWLLQSVWLSILGIAVIALLADYFLYFASMIIGLLPFLYLKNHSKKDVLKINVLSSVIALVFFVIVWFLLSFWLVGSVEVDDSAFFVTTMGIVNLEGLLLRGIIFLVLFNIPALINFFFGKERNLVTPVAQVTQDTVAQ